MAPVLGYWDIRGLAQPIRLLLTYNQEVFEDKRYTVGEGNDRSCWTDVKNSLGLDFPNLPYYIDGDIKLTQSNAILRHIARKYDMCGKSEQEKVMVDILENQLMDFRNGFVRLCYNPNNYEENCKKYKEHIKDTIKVFADFLGEKNYLAGDELTFVDFILFELLDQHVRFEASLLDPHTNLKDYMERIKKLDHIQAFLKANDCLPINNPTAKFR